MKTPLRSTSLIPAPASAAGIERIERIEAIKPQAAPMTQLAAIAQSSKKTTAVLASLLMPMLFFVSGAALMFVWVHG